MRKFGNIVATVILLLSLSACGSDTKNQAPTPNDVATRALQVLTVKDETSLEIVRAGLDEYFNYSLNVKYLNTPINLGVRSYKIIDTWYCENVDTTVHSSVTEDGVFVGDEKPDNTTTWTYKFLVSCIMDDDTVKTCCVFVDFKDSEISDLEIYGL